MSWREKLVDSKQGRIEDLLKPGIDGIKDHNMSNYIKDLERTLSTN